MNDNYYNTREKVEEYIRQAEGYSGQEIIGSLDKYLSKESKILELGSGPGTDFGILSKKYNVVGSDLSIEFLNVLREKFPQMEFLQLDAVKINTSLKFDCIYSNKVLHHLSNSELEQSFASQEFALNPDGLICHSFWKGEGEEIFKGMLVNYQTKESLTRLLQDKFEILVLEDYAEFEENDSVFVIARVNI
ncbi:MAG: class I SAM-dependent methyltransferase [Chlorobiota bacterium]